MSTKIRYMTEAEKCKEDAYIAEMKVRNENHQSEFARGFEAGRKAVLQSKNTSGCACVFDENDHLIEVCKAHSEWLNYMLTMERKRTDSRFHEPMTL